MAGGPHGEPRAGARAGRLDELADVAELGDGAARGRRRCDAGRLELGDAGDEVGADLLLEVEHLGGDLDAGERLVEQSVDVGGHGQVPFGSVVPFVSPASRSSRESMMSRVATQAVTLWR